MVAQSGWMTMSSIPRRGNVGIFLFTIMFRLAGNFTFLLNILSSSTLLHVLINSYCCHFLNDCKEYENNKYVHTEVSGVQSSQLPSSEHNIENIHHQGNSYVSHSHVGNMQGTTVMKTTVRKKHL
jgi:hypothetical protein